MRRSSLLLALALLGGCAGPIANVSPRTAPPAATTVTAAPTKTPRPPAPTQDPDIRHFPETGHSIRGDFRRFWEQHGGRAIFGLPLTEALLVDGVTTQYFENARFEARNGEPVTLGRVGAEGLLATPVPPP